MHKAQISLFWYKSIRIGTYVLNLTGSLDPSKYSMKRLNLMHHAQISLFWYKSIRISSYALNLTGSLDPNKYSMKRLNLMHYAQISFFCYKSIRNGTYVLNLTGSLDLWIPVTTPWKGWILCIMHKYHSFYTNLWELVSTSEIGLDPWILGSSDSCTTW